MANSKGSAAKSSSRRCLTLVKVTTPAMARTALPAKFTVAEKHTTPPLPEHDTYVPETPTFFRRQRANPTREPRGRLRSQPPGRLTLIAKSELQRDSATTRYAKWGLEMLSWWVHLRMSTSGCKFRSASFARWPSQAYLQVGHL